ncbi:MAG: hypothetical protein Q9211_007081, partial [Gyalolechia sp. 1 TL-2023]
AELVSNYIPRPQRSRRGWKLLAEILKHPIVLLFYVHGDKLLGLLRDDHIRGGRSATFKNYLQHIAKQVLNLLYVDGDELLGLVQYDDFRIDITAKTVTTTSARSCPSISLNADDDQGEDGIKSTRVSKSTSGTLKSTPKLTTATRSRSSSSLKSSSSTSTSTPPPEPTTKPAEPTFSPPPPPPHPPQPVPPKNYAMGYFRWCNEMDKVTCINSPAAFVDRHDVDKNFTCSDVVLWQGEWKIRLAPAYNPSYPIEIGPWTNVGLNNCRYERLKDDTAGTMACDHVDSVCRKVDLDDFECDSSNQAYQPVYWKTQVICHIMPTPEPGECFNATSSDQVTLEPGATITQLNHDRMGELVHDACAQSDNPEIHKHKDVKSKNRPTVRLFCDSTGGLRGTSADRNWHNEHCPDNFAQITNDCPELGGQKEINGVMYRLYAVNRPRTNGRT